MTLTFPFKIIGADQLVPFVLLKKTIQSLKVDNKPLISAKDVLRILIFEACCFVEGTQKQLLPTPLSSGDEEDDSILYQKK